MSDSLRPRGLQHARLPCPSPTPRAYSNSCPLSQWCRPSISSSVVPFSSCPLFFLASGSFVMSQPFHIMWPLLVLQLQHQTFQWTLRIDFCDGFALTNSHTQDNERQCRESCRRATPWENAVCVCVLLSRAGLFVTLWTVAHQAPLSMGFFRQEYWSGLPVPSPGDLLNPGIEPESPSLQADSLPSEPPGKTKPSKGHIFKNFFYYHFEEQRLNKKTVHRINK